MLSCRREVWFECRLAFNDSIFFEQDVSWRFSVAYFLTTSEKGALNKAWSRSYKKALVSGWRRRGTTRLCWLLAVVQRLGVNISRNTNIPDLKMNLLFNENFLLSGYTCDLGAFRKAQGTRARIFNVKLNLSKREKFVHIHKCMIPSPFWSYRGFQSSQFRFQNKWQLLTLCSFQFSTSLITEATSHIRARGAKDVSRPWTFKSFAVDNYAGKKIIKNFTKNHNYMK